MVTDIGIEIGKLLYWNRSSPYPDAPQVQVNWTRLGLHSLLVGSFSIGAMMGHLALNMWGMRPRFPTAIALAVLSSVQFIPASPQN